MNLIHKIIADHLLDGEPSPNSEILLHVDQTLTEDATGLTTYLQFEALGLPLALGLQAVSLVDHGALQTRPENAADHHYLRTMAAHHGLCYSQPGSGICHLLFLAHFARPGALLLGADSHTPAAGAVGSVAIGAGGLEVAVAMATSSYYVRMPAVVGIELSGQLCPWVSAKDVILELLRRLGTRWGVGKAAEFIGPGVATLSVSERVTITAVGAELELTTSIFPADEQVRRYLIAQGRAADFCHLSPDPDATYDEQVRLDLSTVEPLIALPGSPGNVVPVREVAGTPVDQAIVGSCTSGSYEDLALVARMLRGRRVPPHLTLAVTPGTRQVYHLLAASGELGDLIAAGVHILEPCCGPCLGMVLRPPAGAVSLRTYPRNFPGRSGVVGDQVYLCSPAVAAASALAGVITDPRDLGIPLHVEPPSRYPDVYEIVPPPADRATIEIIRGPHHTSLPVVTPLPDELRGRVLIVLGDGITTDHIMPAKPETIAACANVAAMGDLTFSRIDPAFSVRARDWDGGFIVAGHNYGLGSSREHAVQGPLVLGLRAVVAKSYARIHQANLVNFGILPLIFVDPTAYDSIRVGHEWEIVGLRECLYTGCPVSVRNLTQGVVFDATYELTPHQIQVLFAGGLLNYARNEVGEYA
ncbi:MAG: aconitate hydratase [Chloroflexota bacterium]|nr:aconitate hydratase [Chloroflexota bacterium]